MQVVCQDGNTYSMAVESMLIIMLCLALDHKATEPHRLKAGNGGLSLGCIELSRPVYVDSQLIIVHYSLRQASLSRASKQLMPT